MHGSPMPRGPVAHCRTPIPHEDDLLVRVAAGDTAAFAELYDRLADAVYGLCRAILRDPNYAEHAAQAALVEIWRTAPRYDPTRTSARSWALTVTHRHAVDQVRSLRTPTQRDTRVAPVDDTPGFDLAVDTIVARCENPRLHAQLAVLTTRQREAIILVYYQGHPDVDAAALAGLSVDTLQAHLREALHRLRDGATVPSRAPTATTPSA